MGDKFENKFSNSVFCGFRPLDGCDFASQNQPQFHKERKLSLARKTYY